MCVGRRIAYPFDSNFENFYARIGDRKLNKRVLSDQGSQNHVRSGFV